MRERPAGLELQPESGCSVPAPSSATFTGSCARRCGPLLSMENAGARGQGCVRGPAGESDRCQAPPGGGCGSCEAGTALECCCSGEGGVLPSSSLLAPHLLSPRGWGRCKRARRREAFPSGRVLADRGCVCLCVFSRQGSPLFARAEPAASGH